MSKLPDDIPDLVESSDDEGTLHQVGNGDYAIEWLKRSGKDLDESDRFIKYMICGPLLFGIGYGVDKIWIEALYSAKIILSKNREKEVSVFNEEEEEIVLLVEKLSKNLQPQMRQESHLRCALDIVNAIETSIILQTKPIDIDKAIEVASSRAIFLDLIKKISESEKMELKKDGQFAVIFIFKNYHRHVVGYSKDAKIIEDDIKEELIKKNDGGMCANACKEKGNEAFTKKDLKKAIKFYSLAILKDPLNHKYYGNRSLAHFKLEKYRESFCDGKRSVVIDPKWEKGYYRCTEAALELNLFHVAMEYNALGRKNCPKTIETLSLYEQEKKIKEAIKSSHEEKKQASKSKGVDSTKKQVNGEISGTFSITVTGQSNKAGGKKDKISGKRSRPETPIVDSSAYKENLDHAALLNDIPALLSDHDSDEGKQKTKKNKKKKKKSAKNTENFSVNKEHYISLLKQGSEAFLESRYKPAVQFYQQSLDYLQHDNKLELSLEEIDIIILKYSYGMASIGIGVYKSVCAALNKFVSIQEIHGNVRFPPVYYGIAKSLVELHRYSDAIEPCKSGLKEVQNGVKCGQLLWPGLSEVIPQTDNKVLEKCLRELLSESCYPPIPDAVCRFHHVEEEKQNFIYYSDLNFKGFIKVKCLSNCCICFHNNCWKYYKNRLEVSSDKEMLNRECPTPDCYSIIYKIVIIQQDSTEKSHTQLKDIPHTKKLKKPMIRMQPSPRTIQLRQERKKLRKQRKQEDRVSKRRDELMNSGSARRSQNKQKILRSTENTANFDISERDVIVLKKNWDEENIRVRNKSSKSKKKKEKKTNHIVNVEVNFNDRKNETLLSNTTYFESLDTDSVSSEVQYAIPTSLQPSVNIFNDDFNTDTNSPVDLSDVLYNPSCIDNISQTLFEFFADILEAHGPLHICDKILQSEIMEFPPEAKEVIQNVGGLRNFLKQSLKFAMIDDYVCVLKDAVKARELSMKRTRNNSANQVASTSSFQANNSSSSHSVASLADIILPQSFLPKPETKGPTPLPLPTKLREPMFDPAESETSSVSASAKQADVNVWIEKTEKRKSVKLKEVKPQSEKFVSKLIKSQNSELRKKSPKPKYNCLDDFDIPCNTVCSSDGISDIGKEKRISDMDDFADNDYYPRSYSPKTLDIKSQSRSSSFSDVSEQSDISLDLLYRTTSPSSVSSRASTKPHHLQQISKISPLSLTDSHSTSPLIPPNLTQNKLNPPTAHLFQATTSKLPVGSPPINGKVENVDPVMINKIKDCQGHSEPSLKYNFSSSWQSPHPIMGSASASARNVSKPNGIGSTVIPPNPFFSSTYSDSDSEKVQSNPWAVSTNNVFESPVHPNAASDWATPKSADMNCNQSSYFAPVFKKDSKMADIMSWNQNNPMANTTLKSDLWKSNFPVKSGVANESLFSPEVSSGKIDKTIQTDSIQKRECSVNTDLDIGSLLVNNKKLIEDNRLLCSRLAQIQGLYQKSDSESTVLKLKIDNLQTGNQTLFNTLEERNNLITGLMDALNKRDGDVSEIQKKHTLLINDQDNSQKELVELTEANLIISEKLDILTRQSNENIERARIAEVTVLRTRLDLSQKSFSQIKKEAMFHIEHLNRLIHKCIEDKTTIPQQANMALKHWKGIVEVSDEKFQNIKAEFEGQIKLIEAGKSLSELPPIVFTPPQLPTPQTPSNYSQGRDTPNLSPSTPPADSLFRAPVPGTTTVVAPPVSVGLRPQVYPGSRSQLPSIPKSVWSVRNPRPKVVDPKTSMEKLIVKLQEVFPRYDENEFKEILLEFRRGRGGTLAGLTLPAIIHYVTEKITKQHSNQRIVTPPGLTSGLSSPSSELFNEEEDPCAICTDDLSQQPVRVLECKHSFHETCIKQWFDQQKTCPTCRGYALLPEEYPSLK